MVGRTDIVWPVHAKRAFLWATIQSTVPSRCTTAKEVSGDLVAIRAVMGDVEDTWGRQNDHGSSKGGMLTRWYRKGIRKSARRNGSNTDSVETALICRVSLALVLQWYVSHSLLDL